LYLFDLLRKVQFPQTILVYARRQVRIDIALIYRDAYSVIPGYRNDGIPGLAIEQPDDDGAFCLC